jgi:glutathionyl-hydroquinone reductase
MMFKEFDHLIPHKMRETNPPGGGFYPEHLEKQIDEMFPSVHTP